MFYEGSELATNLTAIDNIHDYDSNTNNLTGAPTNSNSRVATVGQDDKNVGGGTSDNGPVFRNWKGEPANIALAAAWRVSGGDKDFILTMTAENGAWDLYRKHPKNRNGTIDFSMGLNDAYHKPMIKKILAKEVTPDEIMRYHYEIYKKRPGAYYGYFKRNKPNIKNQIIFQ
jgi:hypothetical protein